MTANTSVEEQGCVVPDGENKTSNRDKAVRGGVRRGRFDMVACLYKEVADQGWRSQQAAAEAAWLLQ